MTSKPQLDVYNHNQWWCCLVSAYKVEAGMVLFAGKTVIHVWVLSALGVDHDKGAIWIDITFTFTFYQYFQNP